MLTCALKAQVNELNVEIFCWKLCIKFNFLTFNKLNAQESKEKFYF